MVCMPEWRQVLQNFLVHLRILVHLWVSLAASVTSRFTSSTLANILFVNIWSQYSTFIHKMTPSVQEVEIWSGHKCFSQRMQQWRGVSEPIVSALLTCYNCYHTQASTTLHWMKAGLAKFISSPQNSGAPACGFP